MDTVLLGTLGGVVAMVATALGAVPALIGRSLSAQASDTLWDLPPASCCRRPISR